MQITYQALPTNTADFISADLSRPETTCALFGGTPVVRPG